MGLKTIILKPGDCAILPNDGSIQSIIIDGDAQISSTTCSNLPETSGYVCWAFYWEGSESGALQDAVFQTLTIGENVYNVPSAYAPYNNANLVGDIKLADWIDTDPQFEGFVKLGCSTVTGGGTFFLKIRIPEGLPAPELKIGNPDADGTMLLYLKAVSDDACECS